MKVMEVLDVSKSYGETQALDKISFSIKKNHIHGLLGPNGAGKSTAMSIMAGLIQPDSGNIILNGQNFDLNNIKLRNEVAILPEKGSYYPDMSVKDFLLFIGNLYLDTSRVKDKLGHVLQLLDLESQKNRLISNLSRGYRQRVGIAQVLMTDAGILILDEPTLGLDPEAMVNMRKLLLELKKDYTILISSHQLHEMGQICDHITLINNGSISFNGSLKEILTSEDTSRLVIKSYSYNQKDLEKIPGIDSLNIFNGGFDFTFKGGEEKIPDLIKAMIDNDFKITEVSHKHYSLEDAFRRNLR